METHYLIVGNSAAAIGAAEAIRQVDATRTLVMVSDEPHPAYSRPLISKVLSKERTIERSLYRPPDFYERNNVTARLGVAVESIRLEQHAALLSGGEVITWKKLLLATGGLPVIPPIKGLDKAGVSPFLTLDHVRTIDGLLHDATRVVVVGGGLIGISAAEALHKRGIEVTVVEMKDRILNTVLDEEGSRIAADRISKAGVCLVTGHTVVEAAGEERVAGAVLDDGEVLPCEVLLLAIGVHPRMALARESGIEVNRGILVDRHMCTSHPDVFSAGDAAEAHDYIEGKNRVVPVWPGAYQGGRTAGLNMAGRPTEYPGITPMNSLGYFGLDIASAGVTSAPADEGWEILSRSDGCNYGKVVIDHGLVKGMVLIGNVDKAGMVHGLMRDRIDVTEFKDDILKDDFGLACMPAEVRQQRLAQGGSWVLAAHEEG